MMYPTKKTKRFFHRRATVIVQTVLFGGAVGVGVAALAVDTGLMYSAKQELQSAADAAALAAASQLGETENAAALALQEASNLANLNSIMGDGADVIDSDVVLGHAVLNGEKYDFQPNALPIDAVRVTLRRDQSAADGPVSLAFAKVFGMDGATMQASATAMLVPRDIGIVIDLSGSMNDDSEFRHYTDFPSETGGTRPGVQINLKDIWLSFPIAKGNCGVGNGIDPAPPGNPNSENDQPGTGPGSPQNAGGNPDPGAEPTGGSTNPTGPRWGWMTGYGDPVTLGSYDPTSDSGLYYVRRLVTTADPDVVENLAQAGYSAAEQSALLSGQYDSSSTSYQNRVKVLLGLAGWKSKKKGSKYTGGPGNGDDRVDSNELTQEASYPFDQGSWSDYISYVTSSSTQMENTDSNLRYRYGIKTVVNYLLESKAQHDKTPELADAPENPLYSVKDSVQVMINEIINLDTQDHVSLESFAQYGTHRVDLSVPGSGEDLATVLQEIPDALFGLQAGHDTPITNIGAGMQEALEELTSERARSAASKVVILLTDGKPNVNEYNTYVGNNHPDAIAWALDRAQEAKDQNMTVYTIGVGGDLNEDMLIDMASQPENYYFADNAPDASNGGLPIYVNELKQIFETLGGKRPVRLIQ